MKITHLGQRRWLNEVLDPFSDLLIRGRCHRLAHSLLLDGARMTNTAGFSGSFFFAHPHNLPDLSAHVYS